MGASTVKIVCLQVMGLWWATIGLIFITEASALKLVPDLDISLPNVRAGSCRKDAEAIGIGLKNDSLWAMRMWDATAQGSSGALYGSTWQLGTFDECLQIREPILTQYCLLHIQVIAPLSQTWDFVQETIEGRRFLRRDVQHSAVCVPASCSSEELEQALNRQVNADSTNGDHYKITVIPQLCTNTLDKPDWTANEICFGIFVVLLILAAVSGTILGRKSHESPYRLVRAANCFSLTKNWSILLDVQPSEKNHPFAVLHGIKVISMVLILLGHRSGVPIGAAVSNYQDVEAFQRDFHNLLLMQLDLVVDTFFFMSGVLTTTFVRSLYTKNRIRPVQAIIARLARIAPAYYLIVWFQASIGHRVGSGPLWNYVQSAETQNCQNYWWANVLFIHNYLPAEKLCHIHSWYLGCDVHFFLITFPLVWILTKKPGVGKTLLAAAIVLTPLLPAYAVYAGSLEPLILFYDAFHTNPRADASFANIYITSHMRITVYLVGVAIGYFLVAKDASKYSITKVKKIVGLVLAAVLMCAPMAVGGLYYTDEAPAPGSLFSVVYAALRRPSWALGLTLFLLLHRFSPKNFVTVFLSNRVTLVLSKLTYTMYLVHFPLILYNWAKVRSPQTIRGFDLYNGGCGDLMVTTIFSAIIFIMVELPIKRLIREVIYQKKLPDLTQPTKSSVPQEVVSIKF